MVLIGADCESSFDQVKEKHSGLICVQKKNTFSLMITAVVGTYISIAKTEKKNDKLPTYIDLIVPVPIS